MITYRHWRQSVDDKYRRGRIVKRRKVSVCESEREREWPNEVWLNCLKKRNISGPDVHGARASTSWSALQLLPVGAAHAALSNCHTEELTPVPRRSQVLQIIIIITIRKKIPLFVTWKPYDIMPYGFHTASIIIYIYIYRFNRDR